MADQFRASLTSKTRTLIVAAAVTLSACSGKPTAPDDLTGSWGGEHVSITVDADRAGFQFDCAHGATDAPLGFAADGRFNVPGYFVAERGGPVDIAVAEERVAATYAGELRGTSVTFTVSIPGNTLGPFTAMKGRSPTLYRCF